MTSYGEAQGRDQADITDEALKVLAEMDRPALGMTAALLGHLGESRLKTLNSLLEAARQKV